MEGDLHPVSQKEKKKKKKGSPKVLQLTVGRGFLFFLPLTNNLCNHYLTKLKIST